MAVLDLTALIAGDDPADLRSLPIIISGNQCPSAVVQFQGRISQCVGNPILSELRANSTHNHPLWLSSSDNESPNHHIVTRLHKGASTDVAELRCSGGCGRDRTGTGVACKTNDDEQRQKKLFHVREY